MLSYVIMLSCYCYFSFIHYFTMSGECCENRERGVEIRHHIIARNSKCTSILENLPFANYDYKYFLGECCENVIGYVPIPLRVAGPLLLNNKKYHIPMATTEGCLVASTNRGCRALMLSGGVRSSIFGDGMTCAPCLKFLVP